MSRVGHSILCIAFRSDHRTTAVDLASNSGNRLIIWNDQEDHGNPCQAFGQIDIGFGSISIAQKVTRFRMTARAHDYSEADQRSIEQLLAEKNGLLEAKRAAEERSTETRAGQVREITQLTEKLRHFRGNFEIKFRECAD
jgi:hypothetical protein